MTASPAEAEATRQPYIMATYQGHDYKLVGDVDDGWPLDLIGDTVGVRNKKLVANYPRLVAALQVLLGEFQWAGFLEAFPKRRHLVPASQAFAAAAGFGADGSDLAFGSLPRLLVTLNAYEDAVEATLATTGCDYRDRWRRGSDGHRLLTLRQIGVRLRYAPPDSPLAAAQNDGRLPYTGTEILLMDVFEAIAKTRHPARPMTPEQAAERATTQDKTAQAVADYRKRHAKTPKRVAIETARSNARPQKAPDDSGEEET